MKSKSSGWGKALPTLPPISFIVNVAGQLVEFAARVLTAKSCARIARWRQNGINSVDFGVVAVEVACTCNDLIVITGYDLPSPGAVLGIVGYGDHTLKSGADTGS